MDCPLKAVTSDFEANEVPNIFFIKMFPDFQPGEFACPCCGENKINYHFVSMLQDLRSRLGRPIVINSAYRCPGYNDTIGGVRDSYHLQGLAVDISLDNYDSGELWVLMSNCLASFFGVGLYTNHLHLDMRSALKPVFWREE